jgi:hypothetical protein
MIGWPGLAVNGSITRVDQRAFENRPVPASAPLAEWIIRNSPDQVSPNRPAALDLEPGRN